MDKNEIVEKLRIIFEEVFHETELDMRDDLGTDDIDGWVSLTHRILLATIEEEFGIHFKLKELKSLATVGSIVASIQEKI